MSTQPAIRYARDGDVHIAYHTVGDAPIDLVLVNGAITHLGVLWEQPLYRRFCEQLGEFTRLILFDKRGMGLSERVEIATLEERMDDVRAVLDAIGSKDAALLGISEGGPLSMLFAAAHPERTRAVILAGAEVKEETTEDWPWGEATRDRFEASISRIGDRWGEGGSLGYFAPSLGDDPEALAWFGRLQIAAATPRTAEAFLRMAFDIDVRDVVPTVRVPTLVLHRVGDAVCHVENGRFLGRTIPGAKYVELDGDDHVPWAGDVDLVVAEIREFLTGVREAGTPDRVLATVLFTDIVGSTERATALGDRAWRELLGRHHAAVRRELGRFRGQEVDVAGDGFLASFDGPARAIRCAQAVIDAVRPLGLEIRAGVHTGECERLDGQLSGVAVHIGARVAAQAAAGEVLVSGTVRDLVVGSGIALADRGVATLKGVPGEWRLFSVVP